MSRTQRVIAMLQGPPSRFWRELGDQFIAAGAGVIKVNFCAADRLYWGSGPAVAFRSRREKWGAFFRRLIEEKNITDVVYYADRMPYHVVASSVAEELGVNAFAIEFGYLRPGWLTLERSGMGAYSGFPADPDIILTLASGLPPLDRSRQHVHAFHVEAFHEVVFNLTNVFAGAAYPFYDPDRFYHPIPEYVSAWIRSWRRYRARKSMESALGAARGGEWPYCLYTLQLQSDWQIRANSPFTDQREPLDMVIASLATDAPPEMRLLVKLHPMDVGMINWGRYVADRAHHHGVTCRVHFVDGGDLEALLAGATCTFVVNSTVGLHAIRAGHPVLAFGPAVYAMPGLTHQGELARAWWSPDEVDTQLSDALVRLLAATIQVRGSFYEPSGRKRAISEVVSRIMSDRVNEPGAYISPPPRLASLCGREWRRDSAGEAQKAI